MKKMILLSAMTLMMATTVSAQFYPDGRPIHPSKRAAYYGQNRYSVLVDAKQVLLAQQLDKISDIRKRYIDELKKIPVKEL